MQDDQRLLEAWRRGDEDAGETLVERHYEALVGFFRTKAGTDAPDLIQRTFLRMLESQHRMREGTPYRCYLFGIARNVLYEHYRGQKRNNERFQPQVASVADLGASPTGLIADAQETELLLQGLRRIPLEFQIILELYYWESMTAKQLAAILDVPEGTARTRLRRAKELLKRELAKLSRSPQLLESTVSDLDSWAKKLQASFKKTA